MTVIGHNMIRKVESFEGYDVLAHPLPDRDDRVFHRDETDAYRVSVTYASHEIRIARPTAIGSGGRLAILMHHGGGRYILEFYESALPIGAALLTLPEREQYALAYAMFKQADECAAGARADEAQLWATAFVDGRIRKRRRNGMRRVFIESPDEKMRRAS
ncbi:hypothetical protein CAF53_02455 [Sphingobium sp. LB126]|uniref:hypothetical protein n=1 Tax=Sphingobium sp. LB126 TaxID=1983755 RepID=UPI000C208E2B|nr:hypothetical protein [Sphingobium sp. LB126]PJG47227.1 hypothetical protein CAF53_02455 [Sphingobium sp. LB126]